MPDGGKIIVHVDPDFELLVPKFLAKRKQEVMAMREALWQQDFETTGRIAHGMKGASGMYGFDQLAAMAATIEIAAQTGTRSPIETELQGLATYLESVHVVFD